MRARQGARSRQDGDEAMETADWRRRRDENHILCSCMSIISLCVCNICYTVYLCACVFISSIDFKISIFFCDIYIHTYNFNNTHVDVSPSRFGVIHMQSMYVHHDHALAICVMCVAVRWLAIALRPSPPLREGAPRLPRVKGHGRSECVSSYKSRLRSWG